MAEEQDLLVIELRRTAIAGGWSILDPALPNISNYRHVIVDATDLQELFDDYEAESSAAAARGLQRMTSKLAEVMRGGAQVAVLLPREPLRSLDYQLGGGHETLALASAVGGPLTYTPDPGLQVANCQEIAGNYFRGIRTVDWVLGSNNPNFQSRPLATGRFGQPLAIAVSVDNGTYVYLPPYPGSASDAIDIVAGDVLGTPRTQVVWPDWILSVPFHAVEAASVNLQQAEADLAAANERLQRASNDFERVRRPLIVLVEQGLRLQQACEERFRDIGVATEAIRTDVSDEFMLCGGPRPILVEVKGLEGPARKGHLTQVHADADNWQEREGREAKPLLLVNAHRFLPLEQRETHDSQPFTKWIEDNAPRLGVALMTTWDLLEVYYAALSASAMGPRLLDAIDQTDGRVDVKKLLQASSAQDQ